MYTDEGQALQSKPRHYVRRQEMASIPVEMWCLAVNTALGTAVSRLRLRRILPLVREGLQKALASQGRPRRYPVATSITWHFSYRPRCRKCRQLSQWSPREAIVLLPLLPTFRDGRQHLFSPMSLPPLPCHRWRSQEQQRQRSIKLPPKSRMPSGLIRGHSAVAVRAAFKLEPSTYICGPRPLSMQLTLRLPLLSPVA
jgi:hypothetical protein